MQRRRVLDSDKQRVGGRRRRWEIMLMPGDDPEQLVQPDTLWQLVRRWVTPEQAEIARLRAEVARLRMERDIAKKAAAYFAKESM